MVGNDRLQRKRLELLSSARSAGLLFTALNLGPAYTHLLEMAPKRAMSGSDWLTTQQAYRDFGRLSSVTFPAALVAILTQLTLVRRRPREAALTALAAGCEIATVAVWARHNEPVNREIVGWEPTKLPENWWKRRDQWELAHATSALLHTIGFAALLGAALLGTDRSCPASGGRRRATRRGLSTTWSGWSPTRR